MGIAGKIRQDLFHHFERRGVVSGHVVRLIDFTDNMTSTYTPDEKARIAPAFAELVSEGVFELKSPDEYILTARGLDLLRNDRTHEPA
jgi:hypothetical protein